MLALPLSILVISAVVVSTVAETVTVYLSGRLWIHESNETCTSIVKQRSLLVWSVVDFNSTIFNFIEDSHLLALYSEEASIFCLGTTLLCEGKQRTKRLAQEIALLLLVRLSVLSHRSENVSFFCVVSIRVESYLRNTLRVKFCEP